MVSNAFANQVLNKFALISIQFTLMLSVFSQLNSCRYQCITYYLVFKQCFLTLSRLNNKNVLRFSRNVATFGAHVLNVIIACYDECVG